MVDLTQVDDDFFSQFEKVGQEEAEIISSELDMPAEAPQGEDFFAQFESAEGDNAIPFSAYVDKDSSQDVVLAEDSEVVKRLRNIDLEFAGIDTGYKVVDVIGEEGAASLVGMGHMMSDSWRGVKQALGFDVEEEAFNEKAMRKLYADKEVGTAATIGSVAGAISEPVGVGLGLATGGLGLLAKIDKVSKAFAVGAGSGAIAGAIGYTDKESGETWYANATLGAALGGVVGGVAGKVDLGRVKKNFKIYEDEVASRVAAGANIDDAVKAINASNPDLAKYVAGVNKGSGLTPDLDSAIKNYDADTYLSKGLIPADTISASDAGNVRNGIDRFVGTVSTRIKNISPEIHGKLRRHDSAVSFRPEKYRQRRQNFADYFASKTKRTQKTKVTKWNSDEVQELNKLLINGKMSQAETFIESTRGPEALAAFKESRKVLDELGDEMVKHGVIKEKITDYWPRVISNETREQYFSELKKLDPAARKEWHNKVKILEGKKGRKLTPQEENQVFMNFLFQGESGVTTVGLAKSRKIDTVTEDWVKYYEDPLQSLDSFIHRSISEIERAKFFGKEVYSRATKATGTFDENEAMASLEVLGAAKNLDPGDANELRELLKVRFGKGMTSAGEATQTYKAIVGITLLGNPVAALTQLGDLGVSMYKNGIIRTAKHTFAGRKINMEDLGLDQQITEFVEGSSSGLLGKLQNFLFKVSFFNAVDRLGKEVFINSALDKTASIIKKDKGSATYRKWQNDASQIMGRDFDDFSTEFTKWVDGGKKKEDMTDNILSYTFSKLADVQPISKSELPEYYLKSDMGKTLYTLKSFMLKQVDILRNDAYNKVVVGAKNKDFAMMRQGGANFLRYVTLVGGANLGMDKVKELVTGKKSLDDLDEDVQAITAASFIASLGGSVFKTFGLNEYTAKEAERSGVKGVAGQYLPPFPFLDELVRVAGMAKNAKSVEDLEEIPGKIGERAFRYIPYIGRFEDRILPEEEKPFKFAEGGLVEPDQEKVPLDDIQPPEESESKVQDTRGSSKETAGGGKEDGKTSKEEKSKNEEAPKKADEEAAKETKVKRLEPGVYEDEDGELFEVNKDGQIIPYANR